MFRIYNASDNILEQYIILKLWHQSMLKHKEENKRIYSNRQYWEKIGGEYQAFAAKILMPFEKKFTKSDDVRELSGQVRIETLTDEKSVEVIYTFDGNILPLYVLYMTELAKQGKHIRTCEICGREFIASRKDTNVCSAKCKSQRHAVYFKEHKEKVKDDDVNKLYQQNRDGYDNFRKKLIRLDIDKNTLQTYLNKKYDFLFEGRKKRKAYRDKKLSKSELLDFIRTDRKKRMDLEHEIETEMQK